MVLEQARMAGTAIQAISHHKPAQKLSGEIQPEGRAMHHQTGKDQHGATQEAHHHQNPF
jgi:hypothetical protein